MELSFKHKGKCTYNSWNKFMFLFSGLRLVEEQSLPKTNIIHDNSHNQMLISEFMP